MLAKLTLKLAPISGLLCDLHTAHYAHVGVAKLHTLTNAEEKKILSQYLFPSHVFRIGVQDYCVRTRVQRDLGTVHVAQSVQKAADLKDKTCFNGGKNPSPALAHCHCGSNSFVSLG